MKNFETPVSYHAAMFKAVGRQTKFSRSGYSVVFTQAQIGRNDLSSDAGRASVQLRSAGIDPASVTEADIHAYQQWHDALYHARRVEQARILVTRKFSAHSYFELIAANEVVLLDGWGEAVAFAIVDCLEKYDPTLTNRIGNPGAFYSVPDYSKIESYIARLRKNHPEFAGAPVVDNNLAWV